MARRNAVLITVAKARKQIPTMLTLGKMRVIGDSGALQIAIWQQIRCAPDLDLFSGPLSLTQQANGLCRQGLGVGGCKSGVGGLVTIPLRVAMTIRYNLMRLAVTSC